MDRKQPPGASSFSPSKKMKTIETQSSHETTNSSSSLDFILNTQNTIDNSLDFLRENTPDNLQLVQSETGNLAHAFDSSKFPENYEALMEADRLKNEITMIPTPNVWTIKKTLTKSDLHALYVSQKSMEEHIFPHLSVIPENRAEISIQVRDVDTDSMHTVCIGYGRTRYDHLMGFWKQEFVDRRGLQEGNVIGLGWDYANLSFVFGLISKEI